MTNPTSEHAQYLTATLGRCYLFRSLTGTGCGCAHYLNSSHSHSQTSYPMAHRKSRNRSPRHV
ncbi:hypothetical protein CGRA01v4_10470 [Colletotrichum graminicola]|nr:hypothetical protein CGRA01v4_10470 [Colletotrichum graminicola]